MTPSNNRFLFETFSHYWDKIPYIFRAMRAKPKKWDRFYAHEELTFVYVFNGRLELNIEEEKIVASDGDLVCINQFFTHNHEILTESHYARIIVSSRFLVYNGIDPNSVLFNTFIHDRRVSELMSAMLDEFEEKGPYERVAMNSLVLSLISYLLKNYSRKNDNSKKTLFNSWQSDYIHIKKALDHISFNFKETITLDDLCQICGLSKPYFMKLFKKYTGTSPLNYINVLRCDYAKQLIIEGMSITDAAFSSGFNSSSYFTLCFKKLKGYLPSEIDKTGQQSYPVRSMSKKDK